LARRRILSVSKAPNPSLPLRPAEAATVQQIGNPSPMLAGWPATVYQPGGPSFEGGVIGGRRSR
jgi:hypothetical protein